MMRVCICHGKKHHEDSLTPISPWDLDVSNGDPQPAPTGTTAWFCASGLRQRERGKRELERGRRAYPRKAKAA